jgi:glutamine phosphoribosylpyrophosphate amidotransferase
MATKEQLIAYLCDGNIDEIKYRISSNLLIYLSREGLEKTAKEFYNTGICG